MTKIRIELEVSSRVHNVETLKAIQLELRRRALRYVFEAIDGADFGVSGDRVNYTNFHVSGDITLED